MSKNPVNKSPLAFGRPMPDENRFQMHSPFVKIYCNNHDCQMRQELFKTH